MINRSCPKCSSVKYIIIILSYFTTFAYTQIYFSPGLQYGFNFDKEHFFSYQITVGYLDIDYTIPGVTFGQRRYLNKKSPKIFNYLDIQSSFITTGFGYGKMWNDDGESFHKFKLFGGVFLYGSYDYINFNNEINNNHHIGLIGVYPVVRDLADY